MNAQRTPIPLRPDLGAVADSHMGSIVRAAIACGLHRADSSSGSADQFLHERGWAADRGAVILTRATSGPALTSQIGWAAELGRVSVSFLLTMQPMSAGAALLEQCVSLSFGTASQITLPNISPGSASFIGESAPIKVPKMPTTAGATLTPCKLASIVVLSTEMLESSNAEQIVRQALIDSTAAALDGYLFDANPAVPGLRPAGLRNGAVSITPATGGDDIANCSGDICALVAAVSAHAGNGSIVFVCSPAQGARLLMRTQRTPGVVLMSSALASGTVLCCATDGIVSAIEPLTIDASRSATVHLEDTTPLPIVGTAGAVAAPAMSVFQMDGAALRIRLPITWAVRATGAVSYVSGANW